MRLFREVAIETPCIGVYQGTPCRCSDRGYYKTRQDKRQKGLAHVPLKLSALQICPVDHFKNYIFQFNIKSLKKLCMT